MWPQSDVGLGYRVAHRFDHLRTAVTTDQERQQISCRRYFEPKRSTFPLQSTWVRKGARGGPINAVIPAAVHTLPPPPYPRQGPVASYRS